jgi:diacylglycerol kinase (ATP)
MSDGRRVHIIVNPAAGRGRALSCAEQARSVFADRGFDTVVRRTEARGHATELAATLRDDARALIAVGGDGTLNEVINGLDGADTPVGIVPCGTGNDLCRMFGITRTAAADIAADLLLRGLTRRLDLAHVDAHPMDGDPISRRFVNTMGVGFDAAVSIAMQRSRIGRGILPYLVNVLRTLRSYTSVPGRVQPRGGDAIDDRLFLACIGNGTTSGGGFRLTPEALPDDGLLDLCHVRHARPLRVLAVLPRAMSGTHGDAPEVTFVRATGFEITLEQPLPAHLDGEVLSPAVRRLSVSVLPGALRLLVP